MKTELNYYREGYGKAKFEMEEGAASCDFLLIIFKGSFWLRLPDVGEEYIVEAGEGVFIPDGVRYERRILRPIDFHQFGFLADANDRYYCAMRAGKLRLPPSHLWALMESLHRVSLLPSGEGEALRLLEHLFGEEYLYASADAGVRFSDDVRDTVEYMSAHLDEKLDVKELAARVYLSHTGLIWKFRRELGVTPLQYLISLRMQLARQLLLEGSLPICEIAERCGYTNAYYFTNAFRKQTGKNPGAFRRGAKKRD